MTTTSALGLAILLALAPRPAVRAQGTPGIPAIAGRYATAVTLGDNSCSGVTVQPLPTIIRHTAGDSAFTLTHGPLSYEGTLARDGSFRTRPVALGGTGRDTTTIAIEGRVLPAAFEATVRIGVSGAAPCRYTVQWAGLREEAAAPAPARGPERPAPLNLTPPAGSVYAIVGATVIPMDRERVLERHTVLVREGRIAAVGPEGRVAIPSDAVRIAGRGKYLIPGLADMHVHLFDRNELATYVANGVTTVRNLHGIGRHLAWRDSLARNLLVGPRIFTSGPILDGDPPTRGTNVVVRSAAEADSIVAAQKIAGFDFIKVYDNVSADVYAAIAGAARKAGLPVVGHLPTPVGLDRMLAAGAQRSLEHVEELLPLFGDGRDTAGIGAAARGLASGGVWVTPTMTVHASALAQARDLAAVRARPELRFMNPATARTWGWEPTGNGFAANPNAGARFDRTVGFFERVLVPALHRAGVRLLAGTDAPIAAIVPGFALPGELASLRRAGLTPWEALRTATANPAEFLGRRGEFGIIAVGAAADLVLLDADPLVGPTALERPRGVMMRGRWLSRKWIDATLGRLAADYAAAR